MPAAASPRLLALDSATEQLAVAVAAGEHAWCAQEEGGARASLRMLPLAMETLARAGCTLGELDAVAFGRGPGAFTGLRTACAVAQGLALGIGCPVLAIDSLLIVAEAARGSAGVASLWVAVDARMDEVYAAAYEHDGTRWQLREPPALWTLPALQAAWRAAPPACVAGNATAVFGPRLGLPERTRCVESTDRAAALARLARAAWQQGEAIDAALALPLYLRDKVALTTAERAAARAGAVA